MLLYLYNNKYRQKKLIKIGQTAELKIILKWVTLYDRIIRDKMICSIQSIRNNKNDVIDCIE